ncbi:Predicted membrane protein [Raoultella ornithinolytica]|nr:Predicted membrane protein [Raoultella ornithinolytica]
MLANTLIFVVAAIHIYILILEMFLWESKTGAPGIRP